MRLFLTAVFILLFAVDSFTQVENYFNYQAVIRNRHGEVLSRQTVDLRVSIYFNDVNANAIYTEQHEVETNKFGVIALLIGKGDVASGDFQAINWSSGAHFLKVEIQYGGDWEEIGLSQLSAVPVAMSAQTAETVRNVDYNQIKNRPTSVSDLTNDLKIDNFVIVSDTMVLSYNGVDYKVDLSPYKNAVTISDTATTTKSGLMTSKEKIKLMGIEENANNYTIDADLVNSLDSDATDKAVTAKQAKVLNTEIRDLKDRVDMVETSAMDPNMFVYYGASDIDNLAVADIQSSTKSITNFVQVDISFTGTGNNKYYWFAIPAHWNKPSFFYEPIENVLMNVFYTKKQVNIGGILYNLWVTDVQFPNPSEFKLKI